MKIKKKTLWNVLLILVVLAFFVTPLGYHAKVLLNRAFASAPEIIEKSDRDTLPNYSWTLKDESWRQFSFEEARGEVTFINFWASWRLPSAAELQEVQSLYEDYGERVRFYIITNEEREPVEEFMEENDFDFPVTYLIIGEPAPLPTDQVPATYIIGRDGSIAVEQEGIADWDNQEVRQLLDELLQG